MIPYIPVNIHYIIPYMHTDIHTHARMCVYENVC